MSANEEMLGDFSSEESETVGDSNEEDAGAYFVFNGDFAPYQGEPLASSGDDMEDNGADEEEDEDGILPSVLEQRFEGEVVVNDWYAVINEFYNFFSLTQCSSLHFSIVRCRCGNCNVDHLVGAREYRCCFEVNEVRGKFTFVGLNAECVLNHPDFSALTNRTVLEQVGPFLQGKDGRHYRRRNDMNAARNK